MSKYRFDHPHDAFGRANFIAHENVLVDSNDSVAIGVELNEIVQDVQVGPRGDGQTPSPYSPGFGGASVSGDLDTMSPEEVFMVQRSPDMTMEDVKMLRGTEGTLPVELPDIVGKESPGARVSRSGRQALSANKSAPSFGVRRKMQGQKML